MRVPVAGPGFLTGEEAVGEIVEAIAMEESALLPILRTECEKIPALAKKSAATEDQLLEIDRSVKATASVVTQLEAALHAKSALLREAFPFSM